MTWAMMPADRHCWACSIGMRLLWTWWATCLPTMKTLSVSSSLWTFSIVCPVWSRLCSCPVASTFVCDSVDIGCACASLCRNCHRKHSAVSSAFHLVPCICAWRSPCSPRTPTHHSGSHWRDPNISCTRCHRRWRRAACPVWPLYEPSWALTWMHCLVNHYPVALNLGYIVGRRWQSHDPSAGSERHVPFRYWLLSRLRLARQTASCVFRSLE